MSFLYDWFTPNIPVWEKTLKGYKNKDNLLFLEIGCFEGQATSWLLKNVLTHPSSKIVVIDTFQGGDDQKDFGVKTGKLFERFKENLKDYISENPKMNKIIIKKGFSGEVLRLLSGEFDFIYVDGSHIAKDVLEDIVLSWNLLKDNGIIIFDDYGWDRYKDETLNPTPAINSFLKVYKGWYRILHSGYQIVVQKKGKKNYTNKSTGILYKKLILADYCSRQEINEYSELIQFNKVIKNSKFYKFWRIYCGLKDYFKHKQD
ncbi:MAG: class I SAM-dependent methyltransferase [Microgenomates group bacterium]|jgi:SAM-dependent methyltransferase